jgi:hypothetical protein
MASCRRQKQEWEVYLPFFDDGKNAQCKYCDKTFQYKSDRAFNHFGYNAKSTQTICSKMPIALKQNFLSCGGIMPTRMSHLEMWGTGGLKGIRGLHVQANRVRTTWLMFLHRMCTFLPSSQHSRKVNQVRQRRTR